MTGSRTQLLRLLEHYENALEQDLPRPVEALLQRHWLALVRQSAWVDLRLGALENARGEKPTSAPDG